MTRLNAVVQAPPGRTLTCVLDLAAARGRALSKIGAPTQEDVDVGCAGTTRSADSLLGGTEEPAGAHLE
jgi:hypothetical protein